MGAIAGFATFVGFVAPSVDLASSARFSHAVRGAAAAYEGVADFSWGAVAFWKKTKDFFMRFIFKGVFRLSGKKVEKVYF